MSVDSVRILNGHLNRLMHRRDKAGVALELQIITRQPLSAEIYGQIAEVVSSLDAIFEAIPESITEES